MQMELQVALNFLISFLYNKLPRRRVNHFGEELEKALRLKFQGHWYPEAPYKGSAYRCVRTTPPLEAVFGIAARESGVDLRDIEENLPRELSIWIDPGEVSYQMSEKGPVKVLYSESDTVEERTDREVTKTFNPEAQCFKPVDSLSQQIAGIAVEECPNCTSAPNPSCERCSSSPFSSGSSPPSSYKSISPTPPMFLNKPTQPLTFTTASFAATKFGSTKLKSNSKRNNGQRMSPTEFSNYIKQRAMAQQVAQQQLSVAGTLGGNVSPMFDRPRSLSPHPYGTHLGSHAGGVNGHSGQHLDHPLASPFPLGAGSLYHGGPPFHGATTIDFARSPNRGRAYSMQTAAHHNSTAHLAASPNHLTVTVPTPLGGSIGLSTSAGNVSTSPSPPSSNGDYAEFTIPGYSSASTHQLLVASN
ncbi:protein Tob1-like isoform X1 [Varroa jacobsoni]|nr:protein Tob1-like isoform X2 [Varroa destructor]XP_022698288.1 protein Tob1-like isoform X1 [Varroa jacobsoni]XP_022698299.1 protein Tob1-like isoform X1 [Varroa jacobsoni]